MSLRVIAKEPSTAGHSFRYVCSAHFRRTYVSRNDITIARSLWKIPSRGQHSAFLSCLIRPTAMARSLGLTLCMCLCFWRTYCQVLQAPADLETYPDLNSYPLPANTGGTFTYPTKITQVYDEGVPMTIAWNTTYEHISLYVAYVHNLSISAPVDGAGNSQRQLQSESRSVCHLSLID